MVIHGVPLRVVKVWRATKLTRLVTYAWKVHIMGSGKSLQQKCRDSIQVQSYTRRVLLNLPIATKLTSFLEHVWTVLGAACK